MVEFDASEVARLAADLGQEALKQPEKARPVIQRGSLNIKRDAQRLSSGLSHAPHYPKAITYDTEIRRGEIVGEIGPDKDRVQGALGNILEYGTSKNAPIPHLGPALKAEEPRFLKAVEDLGEDIL